MLKSVAETKVCPFKTFNNIVSTSCETTDCMAWEETLFFNKEEKKWENVESNDPKSSGYCKLIEKEE